MRLRLRTDGASRGNPGPAGAGMVLEPLDGDAPVEEWGEYLGVATNNVAEYRALIEGLRRALQRGASAVEVVSDSELMVRQVQGRYQVRSPQLAPLLRQVHELQGRFPAGFSIRHTLRGGNARADALANAAIDGATRHKGRDRPERDPGGTSAPQAVEGRRARIPAPAAAAPLLEEPLDGRRSEPAPPPKGRAEGLAAGPEPQARVAGGATAERESRWAQGAGPVGVGTGLGAGIPVEAPSVVLDVSDVAARLAPGEDAPVGGGLAVARLGPGERRAGLAWLAVLQGGVRAGAAQLAAWQCCALAGGDLVTALDAGALVLMLRAGPAAP